jgi:hypothetical protein
LASAEAHENLWESAGANTIRTLAATVTDGTVLSLLAEKVPLVEAVALTSAWLTQDRDPPISNGAPFADDAGKWMAFESLREQVNGSGTVTDHVVAALVEQPNQGVLAAPSAYASWLCGLVFGTREWVRYRVNIPGTGRAAATMFALIWSALERLGCNDTSDDVSFGLMLSTVLEDLIPTDEAAPTNELADFLSICSRVLVETVQRGHRREVFQLFFAFVEERVRGALPVDLLVALVHALSERTAPLVTADLMRAHNGHDWFDLIESASKLASGTASHSNINDTHRDALLTATMRWASPPFGSGDAAAAAAAIRRGE